MSINVKGNKTNFKGKVVKRALKSEEERSVGRSCEVAGRKWLVFCCKICVQYAKSGGATGLFLRCQAIASYLLMG